MTAAGLVVQLAERGDPARLDARLAAVWTREALARALCTAMIPLGWGDRGPRQADVDSRTQRHAVLMIPGLDGNRSQLALLRLFLVRRGWAWVWPVNRGDRGGVLAAEATLLAQRIETLQRASGSDRVDLVAFSTGGLVAAWALRHNPELHARVGRLVTIGTAWRGTRLAVFGRTPGHREIAFGSHVLDGLCPPPVLTVCIWSPDDPGVVPAESALPDHGVESVRLGGSGHVELLFSARVYRAVQAALAHPLQTARTSADAPTVTATSEPA